MNDDRLMYAGAGESDFEKTSREFHEWTLKRIKGIVDSAVQNPQSTVWKDPGGAVRTLADTSYKYVIEHETEKLISETTNINLLYLLRYNLELMNESTFIIAGEPIRSYMVEALSKKYCRHAEDFFNECWEEKYGHKCGYDGNHIPYFPDAED